MENRKVILIVILLLLGFIGVGCLFLFHDSRNKTNDNVSSENRKEDNKELASEEKNLEEEVNTEGVEKYKNFLLNNVLHSQTNGDIHYNVYIPESYDGSEPYALYLTLPGYEGLYFQGVGVNLRAEKFGFEAQKYNSNMIIVAPQLEDWGERSADQTIALVEYFLSNYNIDRTKVYANGYSGGGETMSIVLGKRPDLFTAYLHCSSKWDGAYEPVVDKHIPVYFAVGENDDYYGSGPTKEAYQKLHELYEAQGMTEEEINRLLVLDVKNHDYFVQRGAKDEHGGGALFAYDKDIMEWLLKK
ncbi:alpha/beta hydrolase [Clostridium beijerinckii]|nr:alpha/beta hydrolase [Clostridium beijerinckii]